jgi:hypothetical protein
MAIIGKIRNNSAIIIIAFVIVGIAMLYESFKTANPNFSLFGDNTEYRHNNNKKSLEIRKSSPRMTNHGTLW